MIPPILRDLLMPYDDHVAAGASRQVTDKRDFDVDLLRHVSLAPVRCSGTLRFNPMSNVIPIRSSNMPVLFLSRAAVIVPPRLPTVPTASTSRPADNVPLKLPNAVASAPYLAIDVTALDCDLLAIAAHKFEGPKGAGALYLRAGVHILSQQQGGTQERYRRAGTENVAAAVGMATALEIAITQRDATTRRLRRARERLTAALTGMQGVESTGHPKDRLPGLASIVVADVDGASVIVKLDLEGIGASVGSACTTGSAEPSHVLTAMGYPDEEARGALRFSFGHATTDREVDEAVNVVPRVVSAARVAGLALREARPAAAG